MKKICKKIIEMDCLLAKNFKGKEIKEEQERQKRGAALIRGGAHNRDNTVTCQLSLVSIQDGSITIVSPKSIAVYLVIVTYPRFHLRWGHQHCQPQMHRSISS